MLNTQPDFTDYGQVKQSPSIKALCVSTFSNYIKSLAAYFWFLQVFYSTDR